MSSFNTKFFKNIHGILHKKCTICDWNPLTEFSTNGKNIKGCIIYKGKCKVCERKYKKDRYKPKTHKVCNGLNEHGKYFKGCEKILHIENFQEQGIRKNGTVHKKNICKGCYNDYLKSIKPRLLTDKQKLHKNIFQHNLDNIVNKLKTCKHCNYTKNVYNYTKTKIKNNKQLHKQVCKKCEQFVKRISYEPCILKECSCCKKILRPFYFTDNKLTCYFCNLINELETDEYELDDLERKCNGFCKKVTNIENMAVHSIINEKMCYRNICKICYIFQNKDPEMVRCCDRFEKDRKIYKYCNQCDKWKLENYYSKLLRASDNLNIYCKGCEKIKRKKLWDTNGDKYRESQNKRLKWRRDNDIYYHLKEIFRSRMNHAIKGKTKSNKTMKLIGCNSIYLKEYLETQFREGMNWENYGEWQVDHIVPISFFNLMIPKQQQKAFHYTNCQPLWRVENAFKSAKTDLNPEDYMKGRYYVF
jgi:hypothetical protein